MLQTSDLPVPTNLKIDYFLCSAAFLTKSVALDSVVYKYQIWDTAGQEKVGVLGADCTGCVKNSEIPIYWPKIIFAGFLKEIL